MSRKNIIKYKKIEKILITNNNNIEKAGIMKNIDVPSDGIMTTTTIDAEKAALSIDSDGDDGNGKDDFDDDDDTKLRPKLGKGDDNESSETSSISPSDIVIEEQQQHSKYIWLHAFYHSIVTIIGTGILGFPYATSYLGWYGGKLLFFMIPLYLSLSLTHKHT